MPPTPTAQHYTRPALADAVWAGLRALGKDPDALTPTDLAPLDQFHIGGEGATLALLRLAGLQPGQQVLDLGGGLGGPARTLAATAGLRVTVVDLTEDFVRLGEELTRRVGLADRVSFRHGDATQLDLPPASFDAVWTQHSSMNIADKAALYRQAWRVLRPGGRLALHELMAGPRQPVHFPTHWASTPAISHLAAPEAVRRLLREVGFREAAWHDQTAEAHEWWRARRINRPAGPPPALGLHLVLGPEAPAMTANMLRNLEEDRLAVIMAVWERPTETPA